MSYYKITQGGNVIGVGSAFLRWHPKRRRFMYCDVDDAERVQDAITETLYHADWLSSSPPDAGLAEEAAVEMITASEYDELYALLDDGEPIPIEPEPEPEPDPVPEPTPEDRPMTVQEMREKIAELTSMTAKDNYPQGSYFVLHDEVYRATDPISKGSEIRPGYNCEKKSLDEFLNQEGE